MPINSQFTNTKILYAANLNTTFLQSANIMGDTFTGNVNAIQQMAANTLVANLALIINSIDIGSGLQNAYNAANGAFSKANTGGGGGTGSYVFVANTSQPGLTVNNSVNISIPANNSVVFGANQASTTQVGVVQLNDVMGTAVTTKAATANTLYNAWNYAQSAFVKANTAGTTGASGILQLNDTVQSTSTSLAATANSVNTAWSYAQSAFSRANTLDGIASLAFIASPGLTVNTGVTLTLTGNGTVVISANNATTAQTGIIQLNDTTFSQSTTLAATANSVNTTWAYAQSAFSRANTVQSGGITTYIANTSQPGLTVNNSVNVIVSGNNTLILGANAATTGQVGVVQLNDTTTSILTTQAGTANAVNTAMTYAQGAFANANNALARTGGTVGGAVTVTGNITGANIVTTGSVNSSSIMITPITLNTNYILSQRDNGNVVTFSNSGVTLVNVNNTLSVGFRTVLTQIGTGNVQVQAGMNVTINPAAGVSNQIAGRYSSATLFCYASNTFILDGNLI